MREFLDGDGMPKERLNKARAGAAAMSSYARLRATLANEEFLRVQRNKLELGDGDTTVRGVPAAVLTEGGHTEDVQ